MGQLKMRREEDGFWVVGPDKEVFSDSYVVIPSTYMGSPVIGISDNAFAGFEYIEKVIIEEGVQKIGRGAFYRCFNMDEVFLPESINEIGMGAFDFCYNLRYVVIPDKVESIGSDAFESCHKLRYVTLPKNIRKIRNDAFLGAGKNCAPIKYVWWKWGTMQAVKDAEKVKDVENYGIRFWVPKSNFSEYIDSFPEYSVIYFEGSEEEAKSEIKKYKRDQSFLPPIYRYNVTKEEFLEGCKYLHYYNRDEDRKKSLFAKCIMW